MLCLITESDVPNALYIVFRNWFHQAVMKDFGCSSVWLVVHITDCSGSSLFTTTQEGSNAVPNYELH